MYGQNMLEYVEKIYQVYCKDYLFSCYMYIYIFLYKPILIVHVKVR